MTLAACGKINWPPLQAVGSQFSSSMAAASATFDSTADRLAWVGRSPVADTLSSVAVRTGTVTTGDTIQIQIESVTNGRPSGTIIAAGANGTVAIADTDDNVWKTVSIGTPPTLALGDEFAIVITHSSGSTPNETFLGTSLVSLGQESSHYPILLQDTGAGTWAAIAGLAGALGTGAWEWVVTWGTAGVVPLSGLSPLNGGATLTTIDSGSSPDEIALKFQVPFKCRCVGMKVMQFNNTAGSDFTYSLWPSSSTTDSDALAQVAEDGDFAGATTREGYVELLFDTAVTLSPATQYYAGVRADTANTFSVGVLSAAGTGAVTNAINAFGIPSGGNVYQSTRAWSAGSAGAWTDTTTTLPMIHLIIDQLDDGASAGGTGFMMV